MGNEQSQIPGLIIDEKAQQVTDFWSQYPATFETCSTSRLSVFINAPSLAPSIWVNQTPLEKASKNLMLHRHPCILRYVGSWTKDSRFHLAVENVRPLSHSLPSQSVLQVCVGLHSILQSLVFLHDTAKASHNNVCTASIYVASDNSWKLGGMEYLCKFDEINQEYLSKSRAHRYAKGIDPNEEKNLALNCRLDFIDIYAFGVLVAEVFKNIRNSSEDSEPSTEFIRICKNELHHVDITSRPKLSQLLQYDFFNQDFISIHSFLVQLPLKSDQEKDAFFADLTTRLRCYDQVIVAKQLGGLLLSRMVLLNKTAQSTVVPLVLSLKDNQTDALFDSATFQVHIVPKLLEVFCVRDAQIRLYLLEHLTRFVSCFSKEQLQEKILPELLVGVKDTNDRLVAVTLRALSELVPILGSTVVIGGNRAKLFNDGLPTAHKSALPARRRHSAKPSNLPVPFENEAHHVLALNERPSPDGEEDDAATVSDEGTDLPNRDEVNENEVWDDWDINEDSGNVLQASPAQSNVECDELLESNVEANNTVPDILELDIKSGHQKKVSTEEIDFFQDMEPVINKSTMYLIPPPESTPIQTNTELNLQKFNLNVKVGDFVAHGWGDDLDNWD